MRPSQIIEFFGLRGDTTDPRWAGTAKHVWRGRTRDPHDASGEWWYVHRAINRYDIHPNAGSGRWVEVERWADGSYRVVWISTRDDAMLVYCEGDLTLTCCDTHEEFEAELQRAAEAYKHN